MSEVENVIIVGSGPAGHTAAIYSARANLRPLMFEGFSVGGIPGGQLMTTTEVENYPGFAKGISGPEMMLEFKAQSERFGTRVITQDVDSVDLSRRPFKLVSQGTTYLAKTLIISTGASAKYLGLESEQRLLNRGVSACATCDGALPMFRGKDLVVVGGGDTAMEEALFLTRFASKVILVHRREVFRASKIMFERVQAHEKIEIVMNTEVAEVEGTEEVTGVKLKNSQTGEESIREVAGMFVAIGHQPNTGFLEGQLPTDERGYLLTKADSSHTEIPGVFACGDVQDHVYRQAVTAAGSGCMAAIDAERWLEAQGVA
ncbi:MAG: thioredoxin-disulfide reductase [Myxococcota bacterium]|nr:thioredoxin-disulfide reductase [Myxococcota bacterium]